MHEDERGLLERSLSTAPTRFAREMEEVYDIADLLDENDQLTALGRAWVRGYVTAQLSVLRHTGTDSPALSGADVEAVAELVADYEAAIAAELYA